MLEHHVPGSIVSGVVVLFAAASHSLALADLGVDIAERSSLRLSIEPDMESPDANALNADALAPPRFGEEGSWWWSAGGGFAAGDRSSNGDYNAYFSLHTFLIDDFELTMEFAGWFFDQDADDALAANFNLMFRWHFINRERWSLFAEAGAGVLGATDEVPDGGSEFNFTPRAGMGMTWRFGDGPARLILGGRWQHISNARTAGADRNPGRDAGMVFVGVTVPF